MNQRTLAKKVDRLGQIKAEIAELEEERSKIRNQLLEAGVENAHGDLFDVSFAVVERRTVDWESMQEDYDLPVDDYTRVNESVRMNLTPRN